MSSATAIRYSVEELAAMREASELARELSRLRVVEDEIAALVSECAAFAETYSERVVPPKWPDVERTHGSEAVRTAVDRAEAGIAATRKRLDETRRRHQSERLRERLRRAAAPTQRDAEADAATTASAAHPTVSTDPPTRTLEERVDACLAALDDGAELSEEFISLARTLAAAPAVRAGEQMAYRALQEEVAQLNRRHRAQRAALDVLRRLNVRAGALGPGGGQARAAVQAGLEAARTGSMADTQSLAATVEAAEAAERRAAERDYVERKLAEILVQLGYETVEGFEKVVPQGGQLVRKPGWSHHSVIVQVDSEEISLDVVRTAREEATATARLRDEEAEEAFCADVPGMLDELASAGIGAASVHRIPPGTVAVRAVEGAPKVEIHPMSSRRSKPQERPL